MPAQKKLLATQSAYLLIRQPADTSKEHHSKIKYSKDCQVESNQVLLARICFNC